MPNYTERYNLTKPLPTELYDIEVFNENAEKVDTALGGLKDQIDGLATTVENSASKLVKTLESESVKVTSEDNYVMTICDTNGSEEPGLYFVNVCVRWATLSDNGSVGTLIVLQSDSLNIYAQGSTPASSEWPTQNISAIVPVKQGERIELWLNHTLDGEDVTAPVTYQVAKIG